MNALTEVLIAILNSLWQSALLAGLVWLALRFARGINAATRFAIWWAVLGVVLILPSAPHVIGIARERLQAATLQSARPLYGPASVATGAIEFSPLIRIEHRSATNWPMYVAEVWALIFLYQVMQLGRSYLRVRNIKRKASVSSDSLPKAQRSASLLLSGEIDSPVAVGFARPAVILPASLPPQLSREEMDHVLLHETAHLARWDDWTTLLSRLLGAALALHPVAVWILHRIELERERACDEWVVNRTQSARPYARSLARLYELRFPDQRSALLASGLFSRGSGLAERIDALLSRGCEFTAQVSVLRVGATCTALIALTAVASFVPGWIAFAQAPRPSFDVASIKRHSPDDDSAGCWPCVTFAVRPGGKLTVVNNAMSNVINNAYGIAPYQLIGAPDWINSASEHYDIEAKGAENAGPKDIMLMTQTLLADRFAMRAHFETREMPAYILTVAKGGSKLRLLNSEDCVPFDGTKPDPRAVPNVCGNNLTFGRDWRLTHNSMPGVTHVLSGMLRGPVIDRTGIRGTFDFHLQWSDDLAEPNPDALPPLITAVHETLGLDLKRDRGPVDVLVIDHMERPSAN